MGKIEQYRDILRTTRNWDDYLRQTSGLPGPRGNLELLYAVVAEGDEQLFRRYLGYLEESVPGDSPEAFLAMCGVVGLGRLLSEGHTGDLSLLQKYANDARWRIREAVAMGLQCIGDKDIRRLLAIAAQWKDGSLPEQRAIAAALCEPRLLRDKDIALQTVQILDMITEQLTRVEDRSGEGFRILRQALGYCWSVAVAALPGAGKQTMEKWFVSRNKDVVWIMKENLKKNRLVKMDAAWVDQ